MTRAPATSSVLEAGRGALAAARGPPALALYLLALGTLGWEWLSPISSLYPRGGGGDVLVAAAAVAWAWELLRERRLPRPRPFHLLLGGYLALVVLSALASGTGGKTVLLVLELAVLALLSSEFASDPHGWDGIVLVVAGVALFTAVVTLLAPGVFFAGRHPAPPRAHRPLVAPHPHTPGDA